MTTHNKERDEAINTNPNFMLQLSGGLNAISKSDLMGGWIRAHKVLLAEVEAHERTKSDYQGAMNCCSELAAMRERIAQLEANNNRTHGGPNCFSATEYHAMRERAEKGESDLVGAGFLVKEYWDKLTAEREKIVELEESLDVLKHQYKHLCELEDECNALKSRIEQLEAARRGYASEFDGDVGSIHQNIRALKSQIEQLRSVGHPECLKVREERDELQAACAGMTEVVEAAKGVRLFLSDMEKTWRPNGYYEIHGRLNRALDALLPDAGKQWLERVGKLERVAEAARVVSSGDYSQIAIGRALKNQEEALAELERP